MALLEVSDLVVSYGAIQAVQGLSFSIESGEVVTLIGANGAGKSSTLNAIVRLEKAKGGKVVFDGEDISKVSTDVVVRRGMALSMEGRQIFPKMTVRENLEMGGYTVDKQVKRRRIEEMLDLFPILRERVKQIAGTLSGGEQQMLALTRAMMTSPKLLLLDEPSLGLAPLIVRSVMDTIVDINKRLGTSILLVEQNAKMALSISHRGYVLEKGKIVHAGTAKELLNSQEVLNAYLGG